MYKRTEPNYQHVVMAARNKRPERVPLYEHIISDKVIGEILNKKVEKPDTFDEKREYMKDYVFFFKKMGYDVVSFERTIASVMPGSGSLITDRDGALKTEEDFNKYPWDEIPTNFFTTYGEDYQLLREEMPRGMKAIGGPGNGVFECVQDLVGYTQLSYMAVDYPLLYEKIFKKVGEVLLRIWRIFLEKYSDLYAVCRFGDDLGFKTSTLLSPHEIRAKIIPQYIPIIQVIHSYDKPFLFHSCGKIFDVMDDLIDIARIDAKHSNEDQIAPFSTWISMYGDRIGLFGGIDTDVLCRQSEETIREYVQEVFQYSLNQEGVALGSGNSIPDYVPVSGYLAMVDQICKLR